MCRLQCFLRANDVLEDEAVMKNRVQSFAAVIAELMFSLQARRRSKTPSFGSNAQTCQRSDHVKEIAGGGHKTFDAHSKRLLLLLRSKSFSAESATTTAIMHRSGSGCQCHRA